MWYSGKGDGGTTTAFGCDQKRISKSSELPEALGALDELNAYIGFVKVRAERSERIAKILRNVQEILFIIQAELAGAEKKVTEEHIVQIEDIVNQIEEEIPPLKGFCVAGGTELSALLDVARSIARRAERRVVAVSEVGIHPVSALSKTYLNRLSSLLFALARLANHLEGVQEENPRY